MSITPQGMSVQALYRLYRENKLVINRRYQRKLVWTLDEKRALINSILNGFPIPLFLLAEKDSPSGRYFEVIDGMQRLHTTFSFIENSFSYNNLFFDLSEFARARQLGEQGVFRPVESGEKLDSRSCSNFLDYQLAVTIFPAKNDEVITEVFNRINSYGRRLSSQERRQVASISDFSEIVRNLASEIRGDSSRDVLLLHEMPEISIDSDTLNLGYGIKAEDCFWVNQGILNTQLLRESEDEQFIADIALSILLGKPFAASKEALDDAYTPTEELYREVALRLGAYKVERLSSEIKTVFSVLQDLIAKKPKGYLRSLLRKVDNRNPIKTEFYALYMAFFELIILREMTPTDTEQIFNAVENVSSKMKKASHYVTTDDRSQNIGTIVGLIQKFFTRQDPTLLGHGPGLYLDLINSIRRSRVETPRYEFKQGIVSLDSRRQVNEKGFEEILKTATAIANCGPEIGSGFIFIGVADKDSDAERIKELDKVVSSKIDGRNVVGVEREAIALGKTFDQYMQLISSKIRDSKISEPLKTHLLSHLDVVDFQGLQVIRISIPQQKETSFYDNQVYFRDGSSTLMADGKQTTSIAKLFA